MLQQSEVVYKDGPGLSVADNGDADNGDAAASASASALATSGTAVGEPWWEWVERHVEYRQSVMHEVVGQVLGEFQAQAREHCEREVGHVKRELELTRRELGILREEVELERGLRDLRAEVDEARKEVPKVPAIAAQLATEL
jgi:hypothetical protein